MAGVDWRGVGVKKAITGSSGKAFAAKGEKRAEDPRPCWSSYNQAPTDQLLGIGRMLRMPPMREKKVEPELK